jgi:solute carrier family 45, member 1/2/4
MQCWAPFTFLGIEINRLNSTSRVYDSSGGSTKTRNSSEFSISEKTMMDFESVPSRKDDTGVYLGILNLYTTLPQFISTFISWTAFSILEPGKSPELARHVHPDEHHSTDGVNAISVCLFIGAMTAILAAYETRKLNGE